MKKQTSAFSLGTLPTEVEASARALRAANTAMFRASASRHQGAVMAKAVLIRKAVVGYPAIAEHKVAGEVYIPGVDAVPSHPGEVQVTMTEDEAEKVLTILGGGVCTSGGVPLPEDMYMALSELFKGARKYRMHSANPANPEVGWPYLIRR